MSSRSPSVRSSSSQRRRRSYVELKEEEILELRLQRRKWSRQHGLGLTVAGGGGSFPYRGVEEGIFVAKLIPGGAADSAGLKIDDEILTINGIDCSILEHAQAVNLLRNFGGDLIVRVRRQIPRLVESAIPAGPNFAPLVRSRSSYQLNPSRRVREDQHSRSRTPDPPRRIRSYREEVYPPTPVEESGYLRPRTPPLRRMSTHQPEPPSTALQHSHLDSSGVHFHPYCFACNPSVIHLNSTSFQSAVPLQLPSVSHTSPQHIYASPNNNGYPSSPELDSFNSKKWILENDPEDDSDNNRFTVRLRRDEVTGLGFIVSSRDGQSHSSRGVYVSGIVKGGVADRSGQLAVGDQIISINGLDVKRARHSEVVGLLSRSKPYVQLEVERDPSVDYPDVFESENEPENFTATRTSTQRSSLISNRSETGSLTSAPWKSNYSQINHNPVGNNGRMPLKSSLKSSHQHFPRHNVPIATAINKRPERYPSPPSSPSPPPPRRLSTSSTASSKHVDANQLMLNELQFPPPPTELGRFRETITKNTLTETVVTRLTSNQRGQPPVITEDVLIRKDMGTRLGLRIAGGKDSSCIPFGTDDEPGIFISRVIPHGTAGKTGRLRIGDRLLKINGKEVVNWTHPEVVRALCEPAQQIILTVRHDPQPEGLDEFLIQRKDDEQFGIKIIGGVREPDSYCAKKYDSGVFVSQIHRGGAIAKDGRVKVGMRLLEVNGTNVIGVTRREAIEAFRRAGHVLRLMVCDGWKNEKQVVDQNADDLMSNRSSVMSNSSWSDQPGSIQSARNQLINGSKQPNANLTGSSNQLNSAKSTPSLSKKKFMGMKLPDLAGSKHFPRRNSAVSESDVKTTTIVLSKTTVDQPDKEVFDEDYDDSSASSSKFRTEHKV